MVLSKTAIPASVRPQGRLPDQVPSQEARVSRAGTLTLPKPFPVKPFLVTGHAGAISPQNPKLVARVDSIAASAMKARTMHLPQEPEDAKLTGVTRSLNRRLLGLNLGGSLLRPA